MFISGVTRGERATPKPYEPKIGEEWFPPGKLGCCSKKKMEGEQQKRGRSATEVKRRSSRKKLEMVESANDPERLKKVSEWSQTFNMQLSVFLKSS